MRRVSLLLPEDLVDEVKALADDEVEGKINVQIRKLLREALAVRRTRGLLLENEKGQFEPWPPPAVGEGDVRPERGADPFATH